MPFNSAKTGIFLAAIILSLAISGFAAAQGGITELAFGEPDPTDVDVFRTLQSVVRVTDGLYLMSHYGDRAALFERENRRAIDDPLLNDRSRHCSVFSTTTGKAVVMGRNWDNENVGAIIVSLYYPPGKYASISFCRSVDLGFGKGVELERITSLEIGRRLLLAPFHAMDGINSHGLAVGVAATRQTAVGPESGKELVYLPFLIRTILDQAKNVDEAAKLVESVIPFDIDEHSVSSHLFVVDASGRSVILEYEEDQWRTVFADRSWQVMSTKPVYNVPDADLRENCWRYRGMSEALESAAGDVDWRGGMRMLRDVEQKGTTWSIVYLPMTREVYFSVYKQWDDIYHLALR
jgi:hypothetical protein